MGWHLFRKIIMFLSGILAFWIFVFVLAPAAQRYGPVKTIHDYVRDHDIDATPLYYTESEEFGVAESYMKDARRFTPVSRGTN